MQRIKQRIAILLTLALVLTCASVKVYSLPAYADSVVPGSDLSSYTGDDNLAKDHVITGRVSTPEGKPAIAQEVRVEKQIKYHADFDDIRTAWVTYDTALTDENGEYSIPVASYRIYRVAAGGSLSVHTDPIWINDNDATLNINISFHTLQGMVRTFSGTPVSDTYVTMKKLNPIADDPVQNVVVSDVFGEGGEMLTYSDTATGDAVYIDPVEDSAYEDDMDSVATDGEGVFTFGELPPGDYLVMVGHMGLVVRRIHLSGNDFLPIIITDDQALVEEYSEGIYEEEIVAESDYGIELDLPGKLVPTPTPKAPPMAVPNMNGPRLFDGETIYTDYAYTLDDYAMLQYRSVPRVSYERYVELLDPSLDTTRGMKFLRVDSYRPVNEEAFTKLYQSMIESYCRAVGKAPEESVLYGHADVILKCAKKYEIDPIFLVTQTFHESAYGTSHLASGITIDSAALPGYPRDSHGRFVTKPLDEPVTVYNLYGIKAYDADPMVGGTSYAYYNGWTTPKKAIEGAAEYLYGNYIHGDHQQNTPFKIRFSFRERIWHQYATGPTYAEDLARYMISMAGVYSSEAKFTYDLPRYK